MPNKCSIKNYSKAVLVVILASFIIRAFFANNLELGNDEVYYWLLAKYPALSYFDHPPMFSWFINLFSFGLFFESEIFVRLSSLIIFSINTWIIYITGKEIRNPRTGFLAALLYQSSIYSFVITGIMIIPDTPLSLFWLLAIRSFIIAFSKIEISKRDANHMIWGGLFIGLATISKYQSAILWIGVGAYIIFHNRAWLKKPQLYISVIISLLCLAPVILWNYMNEWASLGFQTERVSVSGNVNPLFFMREFFGQLVYNNPINVVLSFIAIFSFNRTSFLSKNHWRLLLWLGIPLIGIFLFFSLFRPTLPHWSAPGYYALMYIAAAWLDQKSKRAIPIVNTVAIVLILASLAIAYSQINYGLIYSNHSEKKIELGQADVTLDLYGWGQVAEGFIKKSQIRYPKTRTIIAHKWYNAAHLDYYLAQRNSMELIAVGSNIDIHEYTRINKQKTPLMVGDDAWFISMSRDYQDPHIHFSSSFENIRSVDTISIYRNSQAVEYAIIFHLENYLSN